MEGLEGRACVFDGGEGNGLRVLRAGFEHDALENKFGGGRGTEQVVAQESNATDLSD